MATESDTQVAARFMAALVTLHRPMVDYIASPEAAAIVDAPRFPVRGARRAIVEANGRVIDGRQAAARTALEWAMRIAERGAVAPDPDEWSIDEARLGRAHACMWGAIARSLLGHLANDWFVVDQGFADTWFGASAVLFVDEQQFAMAGRALQEWAEARRMFGDTAGAELLFAMASAHFVAAGRADRAAVVARRLTETGPVPRDSAFLAGRTVTDAELRVLTTVLGSRNATVVYTAMSRGRRWVSAG
ncbi:MAG: hypothetical protein ACKOA2_10240 [Ilumatobacteraceae bacterium]